MTNRRATYFYVALLGVIVVQALALVLHSGQALAASHQISMQEKTKHDLLAQRQELQQQLGARQSLLHVQSSTVYNEFQPVTSVINISPQTTVAWR